MTALAARYYVEVQTRIAPALVCLVSVAVGWKVGHGATRMPIALTALITLTLIATQAFGVASGLLLLAALNGLPFVDLEEYAQTGTFRVSDVALVVLIAALALRNQAGAANPVLDRWMRWSRAWGFALGAYWLLTVLRTNLFDHIPLMKAALFGRDFAYFAVLLPLFVGGLRTRREIRDLLLTLACGTVVFAAGHIALVVTNAHEASWFVHQSLSNDIGGITRVYALMGDAVVAATPFGLALALMGPSRRLRALGATLAVVSGISVLLQFARATYFGLFLGLLCASALWLVREAPGPVARRLTIVFAALSLVAGIVLLTASRTTTTPTTYAPAIDPRRSGALPAPAVFASRFSSGIADLSSGSGTVKYRYDLDRTMLQVLGRKWFFGLGFLHPDVHFVPNLPDGSIRNTDTGVMNSVMTMGVVGTVLIYIAPLAVLVAIVRRRRTDSLASRQWFLFAMFTWIVTLVVGSLSLVTLFSVPGVALTSALLGCTIRVLAEAPAVRDA